MKFRTVRIKISRGWTYALYSVSFLVLSFLSAHAGTLDDSFRSKVVISGVKPQAGDTINGWVHDSDGPLLFTNVVERDINENAPLDIESLAGLVGVKKSKLKAVRLIGPQSEATAIEVITRKYYRQLRREGRLDSSYKNLDVF